MLPIAAWLDRRFRLRSGGERMPTLIEDAVLVELHAEPARVERPVGVGTPFERERAFARWPHLVPRSGTRAAYALWRDYHEHDDPDAYWYEELCRLAGRSPEAPPATAPAIDLTPTAEPAPPVASDADLPDLDQDDLALDDTPPVATFSRVALPTRQQLEVQEAAERFVAWVRECGRCGTYLDRDFSDLCAEFFEAEDLEPIADNVLRPVLRELTDDVLKSRTDRGAGKGKRKRHYRWTILEPETVETTEPWANLPMRERRAA